MAADPFALLGVDADADEATLAAARRRRAWEVHPDRGGSVAAMQEGLFRSDAALRHLQAPAPEQAPVADAPPPRAARPTRRRQQPAWRVVRDESSFTIDALPVDAFEALVVVTSWLGELLVDDPPYVLEAFLMEPEPCWCRLDLVPDAGGSTVSITVAGVEGPAPDIDDVRDVWVAALNRL
ncbi:MAG TPA: hypothetical protein DCR14_13685 [Acidimicrobiaceae bacterium]|nr:hypothetical protein [Acidimicrobiaceae bacterium]